MAHSIGQANWVIDDPEPEWEHEDEYQEEYKTLLRDLRSAVQSSARDDFERCNWLLNRIRSEMEAAILTARRNHDDYDD